MWREEEEKVLKEGRKLSWENRLLHKNWKVRNDANINLATLFASFTDPKDPRLREFGPFLKKSVADSNAAVQDKALDALISYLKVADADAGRFAKEVCDAVVAKCLIGRPKTVEKAQMIFMLWVELEAVEAFMDAMEKAIKAKVAKAVVPAIDVMFQALSEFGSKVVPPKRVLKMLPELLDHQDQSVRASSKGLTLELCRWIGKEPVKSILFEKMRDTMKKELEVELANVSGTARPTRKIRSEQDKEPEQETVSEVVGSGHEDCVADVPQDIDEYELVDPVDILTPLEKTGFWVGVKATKWSERKEAVTELTKLASTKRISPGDFTEICRTLKKLINDVNIAVAVEAIQAIGNLAKGLRTHFSGSSRFLLPILLEKLKEKKPTLTEALSQTLQAMYKSGCLNLAEIAEEIKAAVKNKVPLVRSLTLNWVTFCIETSNKAVVTKIHKEYVPICMECLNDGTPDVRDAAFSVLAAVAKMVGMRPLEKVLEKLDDIRRKKLSEMIGNFDAGQLGTVAVKSSAGAVSPTEASEGSFVRKSAANMLSGKKHVQAAPVSKKGKTVKSGVDKKGNAAGRVKAPKPVASEDIKVNKHVKDSQGTSKAFVAECCKPHGAYQETCELSKAISLESTSVSNLKGGRSSCFGDGDRNPRHGGRAVSSRAVSVKASRTESVLSSQPLLNVKDSNKGNRERVVVRRYTFEELRPEQIHELENDLRRYFREDLQSRLLSSDFKHHIEGIDMLHKALSSIGKEIIEVLDVLLRWVMLRFCESNTTCLLKVLDFLPELFDSLRTEGYTMTKSEAAIFIPIVVEKSGYNNEKVREKMRELIKQIIQAYSAAKTFPYILEGLRSRNNRTRIECSNIASFIIDNHGAEIVGHMKNLKVVVNLTVERDGETRKSALNALAAGYKFLGDDIWRYVGILTDAQRSLLNDKFKWKAREMDNKKEGRPGEAWAVLGRSVREIGLDVAKQSDEISRYVPSPVFSRENLGPSELNMMRHSTLETSDSSISPADLNEALEFIEYGSPEQSIEGMKLVCHELVQATSDPEGGKMDDMLKDTDRLASCLANKVRATVDFSFTTTSSRSCKYVLNTLMQIFKNKKLSHTVKKSTLDRLITELLLWFSDERVPQMDDGDQLLQFLNVLIHKILDNAERTSSIVVLNNLLRPLDPSRWPSLISNESFAPRNKRFFDLVAICLTKLTKMEKNAAAGRTPSSEPLSNPSPASTKLPLPKFAAVLRLNRIPLIDANSMNELVKTSTSSHQCEGGPKD